MDPARRTFLLGGATVLIGCSRKPPPGGESQLTSAVTKKDDEPEVGPIEDLMREHGVLRRALVVYRECATRLRKRQDVPPDVLQRTAKLFHAFGEDYHEKKIEE